MASSIPVWMRATDVATHCTDMLSWAGLQTAGDEGEGVSAATFRMAPRPQALRRCQARTRTGFMADWVSGARLLTSNDAGLRPAARLPRSRCAARSACSPRATTRGQGRSIETTWQQVLGARTTGGGRFPKLTVRVRFPSPAPHAKSVAAQANSARFPKQVNAHSRPKRHSCHYACP